MAPPAICFSPCAVCYTPARLFVLREIRGSISFPLPLPLSLHIHLEEPVLSIDYDHHPVRIHLNYYEADVADVITLQCNFTTLFGSPSNM